MPVLAILTDLRFQDVLDILFLAVVVYHLYLWFWGTKAFKALVGLLVLGVVFTLARFWGLFLTTWVFQILWQVLIVLIIILFQSEIRQVLERVNPLQMLGLRSFSKSADWVASFVKGIHSLAEHRIGALIIFERVDLVSELITGGIALEGEPSSEILVSVFQKESPLHDGALLIRKGRVAKAACYLPLSSAEGLPKDWGTRHRAALGLSERCDAWVVVVSEERGDISLAHVGQMIMIANQDELTKLVRDAIAPPAASDITWLERIRALVVHKWPMKLGALGLVFVFWLLLAGQQNFEVTFTVPVEMKDIPENIELLEPLNPEVLITVRGLRKDASTLNSRNVHAEIDLSPARFGSKLFRITRDQIDLPNDRISIVNIKPTLIEFRFKKALASE
jgi:diadenylate cyclase